MGKVLVVEKGNKIKSSKTEKTRNEGSVVGQSKTRTRLDRVKPK